MPRLTSFTLPHPLSVLYSSHVYHIDQHIAYPWHSPPPVTAPLPCGYIGWHEEGISQNNGLVVKGGTATGRHGLLEDKAAWGYLPHACSSVPVYLPMLSPFYGTVVTTIYVALSLKDAGGIRHQALLLNAASSLPLTPYNAITGRVAAWPSPRWW